jgi:oligoribonuclease
MEIMMSKSNDNLIWLDMEMSGLNSETDKILEIAVVVTDPFLKILANSPVLVINQSNEVLAKMDSWNQSTHGKSGLIEKVKNSKINEDSATHQLLEFLR